MTNQVKWCFHNFILITVASKQTSYNPSGQTIMEESFYPKAKNIITWLSIHLKPTAAEHWFLEALLNQSKL